MRKMMVLAAVVAALAMVLQPTEARDRGFSAVLGGPKLHLRHSGFKFHHGGFVGKPRLFKSRHFGHFSRPGRVLKFGDGDFVLRFGDVPHFKHRHFGHKRHHHTLLFGLGLDLPRQFGPWPVRGLAFEDRLQGGHRAGPPHGAPPEALLEQLEQMGLRHVPELLRGWDP